MQLPKPQSVSEAILLTLAYFDAVGLPATTYEIWHYLIGHKASYYEVDAALHRSPVRDLVTHDRGYYSIRGQHALEHIAQRFEHQKRSEDLWRSARATATWLSAVPFVSSVSVANSAAVDNAGSASDLDLFIVAKPGRLWLSRFLVTGIVNVLGRRRHGVHVAGRACLSFYVTENALNFEQLTSVMRDPYLAHWILQLGTLVDRGDLQQDLAQRHPWVSEIFPQAVFSQMSVRRKVSQRTNWIARNVQSWTEQLLKGRLGSFIERRSRSFQLHWMKKEIPFESKTASQHIVITDDMLKFHEQDRRQWFMQKTIATYERLIANNLDTNVDLSAVPHISRGGLQVVPVGATVTSSA